MTQLPTTEPMLEHSNGHELPHFLTFRIARVQAKLNAQASQILKEAAGLSITRWRIIVLLAAEIATTASALTRYAAIDKGQFSRTLKAMIAEGLVIARPDETDHRQQQIALTARGRRLHDQILPKMRARQQFLLGTLAPDSRDVVFEALEILERAAEVTDFASDPSAPPKVHHDQE